MDKVEHIKGAVASRIIAALGLLGIRVQQKRLVNVLARQYGETASIEAFEHRLSMLKRVPSMRQGTILIPDDMHKGLSFVRRHVGSPKLLCLSNFHGFGKRINIFF